MLSMVVPMPVSQRRARGDVIRALRLAHGHTLTHLADQLSIDPGHLSHIEAGRRAGSRRLDALSDALGVDVAVILGHLPPLAALRDAAGLTAPALAAHVGITPGQLADLEEGREYPSPRLASRIAVRLGIDPTVLHPTEHGAAA